ncbi:MAG: 50S ribosomal protein L30 [Bdellovibrio sp.]|nr:MAG: 50S ribosomal protein L30 [Bdellovibrio sp.]
MAKIRVRLKKSLIGASKSQRDTVRCLGLKKINSERVFSDNPAIRGQIFKVQHLLEVKMEK